MTWGEGAHSLSTEDHRPRQKQEQRCQIVRRVELQIVEQKDRSKFERKGLSLLGFRVMCWFFGYTPPADTAVGNVQHGAQRKAAVAEPALPRKTRPETRYVD